MHRVWFIGNLTDSQANTERSFGRADFCLAVKPADDQNSRMPMPIQRV